MTLALWWIGRGPALVDAVERVRAHVGLVFARPVAVGARSGRPADAYDPRRGQVLSSRVVAWLAAELPVTYERVLAVTDEDLFIPVLSYVFGEAQLNGRAAVVSTARLGMKEPLASRLQKEAVHELGHTFGLLHCDERRCAMSRSAGLTEVDAKTAELCASCRQWPGLVRSCAERGE